ncbi:MAG: hypothetical protein WD361_04585 [Gracilimonas sp.]
MFRYIACIISMITLLASTNISAQTCSCAGAPLISSQNFTTVSEGNLVAGLTWEYNNISKLYNGSNKLENLTQERSTKTALLELNYGISNRFSLTSTFTFIEKRRTTGLQIQNTSNTVTTSGLGDGLVMAKYHLINQDLWNPYQVSIGMGTKIPFATTSLKANNLSLNADMQPGTGAWDGIAWLFASRVLRYINMNVYFNSSFRYSGTSERFNSTDKYRFGNEFVSLAGVTGAMFDRLSFDIQMKFRKTNKDQRNKFKLPNTGGEWLNIKSGIVYQIHEQINIQLRGEAPIYQHLDGTQPTTTFIVSGSVFFSLKKAQKGFTYGTPD